MSTLPWFNWLLAWGLTAVTGVRGEMTTELPFLGAACWGDFTGDKALGGFPCRLFGILDAVETIEPEDFLIDGPIFAGGCNPGVPLA